MSDPDQSVDQHVRTYLVDKLRLMHQRLTELFAQGQGEEQGTLAVGGAAAMAPGAEAAALFELLPVAVCTMDLSGRFLFGNRKTEQLTGYPREELAGKKYFETDLIRFADLIRVAALLGIKRSGRSAGPFRVTVSRKDGSLVKLDVIVQVVRSGNTHNVVCVAWESTGRGRGGLAAAGAEATGGRLNRGAVPISLCGICKKVEDIDGDWIPLEYFLYKRLELEFIHETCPDCMERRKKGEIG